MQTYMISEMHHYKMKKMFHIFLIVTVINMYILIDVCFIGQIKYFTEQCSFRYFLLFLKDIIFNC